MPLESRNIAPELNGNAAALLAIIGQAVDTSQKIILFNQAAESVFGRTADTMLGQPIDILLPERFRQGHAELMQSFTQSGRTQRHIGKLGVIWGLRADGTEFPAEAAISRTESDGKIILAVILRDITEREQIQNELIAQKNLHAMISDASQAIAQAADEKDIFRKICCIAVERGYFKFAWIGKINEARDAIVPVEKYGDDQGFLQEIGQLPKESARELHRHRLQTWKRKATSSTTIFCKKRKNPGGITSPNRQVYDRWELSDPGQGKDYRPSSHFMRLSAGTLPKN